MEALSGGLRETKKARTRLAISDAATRLFAERGFEQVTIAEIAAASDVSVKTVFNYFAAKEDLFFDRAGELIDGMERTIVHRTEGVAPLDALRGLLRDNMVPFGGAGWGALRNLEGYARYARFVATEHSSPALRARRLVIAEAWTERLSTVLGAELGLPRGDPRGDLLASLVIAVLGARERTLSAGVLAGASARTIERRVKALVDVAFDGLDAAFGALRPPPDGSRRVASAG